MTARRRAHRPRASAAASPPTRPARCCGCSPRAGTTSRVVPTAAALRFVGAPTWAALSGKPVATEVWTDVHEVPHVRLGQQADLVVVAPATADLLARAAHGLADDLLTNTLLTARCPVLLAPAMHTEMWEHPATQANVATLRARGVHVLEPAVGRLTGADTGPGRLPEPEEHLRRRAARCCPAAAADRRPADLAGRARRRHRRRHPRAARPGALPRQPLLGQAGLRARRAWPRPAAPTVTLVAANPSLPAPAGVDVVPVGTAAGAAGGRRRRRPRTPTSWSWPPPSADFRPGALRRRQDQEDARCRPDPTPRPTIELVRNPDVLAGLVARARRRGRPGDRRLRRRDRRRRPARPGPRPGQAGPQGLRPARGQRGRRRQDVRPATTTPCTILRRGSERRHRRGARAPRRRSRPRCGTSSQRSRPGRLATSDATPAASRQSAAAAPRRSTARVRTPVHVRVRHRGPPGQDLRPDQRLDPRRHARRRTRTAASRSRRWSPPGWCTSPAR